MWHTLAILVLSTSLALAETASDQTTAKFSEIIRTELKTIMEAQIAKMPPTPQTENYKQNIDAEVNKLVPQAISLFKPELEISEAEATELLRIGPDDTKNKEKIQENRDLFQKYPEAKPVLVTLMLERLDRGEVLSGWALETLRRLTDGTVRQLKEREKANNP